MKVRAARFVALDILGGKCVKCGFEDPRALQIDHVNDDGCVDRKEYPISCVHNYERIVNSFLNGENKFQLLCANCNWIKKWKKEQHARDICREFEEDYERGRVYKTHRSGGTFGSDGGACGKK